MAWYVLEVKRIEIVRLSKLEVQRGHPRSKFKIPSRERVKRTNMEEERHRCPQRPKEIDTLSIMALHRISIQHY